MAVTKVEVVRVQPLDNVAFRALSDGSGNITFTVPIIVPSDQYLEVWRILIASASASFTSFSLYANSVEQWQRREWINVGPNNVAAEPTPVIFAPNEQLIAQWVGLGASNNATLVLQGWFVKRLARAVPDYDTEPTHDEGARMIGAAVADAGRYDDIPARLARQTSGFPE